MGTGALVLRSSSLVNHALFNRYEQFFSQSTSFNASRHRQEEQAKKEKPFHILEFIILTVQISKDINSHCGICWALLSIELRDSIGLREVSTVFETKYRGMGFEVRYIKLASSFSLAF